MNHELKIILAFLMQAQKPVSLSQIHSSICYQRSKKTLRRRIQDLIDSGKVQIIGAQGSQKYRYLSERRWSLKFLEDIPEYRRKDLLQQIKEIWTHDSAAIEGNTITLGDTHLILSYGLTISGKSILEHQEITGHARAIDLISDFIESNRTLTKEFVLELHKAVMDNRGFNIFDRPGEWKVEPNGTNAIINNKPTYIRYAYPIHVDALMSEFIDVFNSIDRDSISLENSSEVFAKIHAGISQIHPFYDGNGRMARLVSNIPIIQAGFPPIVISSESRNGYIKSIMNYTVAAGMLTNQTGVYPDTNETKEALQRFSNFCQSQHKNTIELVELAKKEAGGPEFS